MPSSKGAAMNIQKLKESRKIKPHPNHINEHLVVAYPKLGPMDQKRLVICAKASILGAWFFEQWPYRQHQLEIELTNIRIT
jgi:hypothetical protein